MHSSYALSGAENVCQMAPVMPLILWNFHSQSIGTVVVVDHTGSTNCVQYFQGSLQFIDFRCEILQGEVSADWLCFDLMTVR